MKKIIHLDYYDATVTIEGNPETVDILHWTLTDAVKLSRTERSWIEFDKGEKDDNSGNRCRCFSGGSGMDDGES